MIRRDLPLRGEARATKVQVREAENEAAVGGMRNPLQSLRAVPGAGRFALAVRPTLDEHLRVNPGTLAFITWLVGGGVHPKGAPLPPGLSPEAIQHLRVKLIRCLGGSPPGKRDMG